MIIALSVLLIAFALYNRADYLRQTWRVVYGITTGNRLSVSIVGHRWWGDVYCIRIDEPHLCQTSNVLGPGWRDVGVVLYGDEWAEKGE